MFPTFQNLLNFIIGIPKLVRLSRPNPFPLFTSDYPLCFGDLQAPLSLNNCASRRFAALQRGMGGGLGGVTQVHTFNLKF